MITIPGGGQLTRTTQTAKWVVTTMNRAKAFKSVNPLHYLSQDKSSISGAVTSLAYQGDTSGPGGECNGQQPCSFGRSCNDAAQADERTGTEEKNNLRHNIRTGTWNVRSMTDPSKLHILRRNG